MQNKTKKYLSPPTSPPLLVLVQLAERKGQEARTERPTWLHGSKRCADAAYHNFELPFGWHSATLGPSGPVAISRSTSASRAHRFSEGTATCSMPSLRRGLGNGEAVRTCGAVLGREIIAPKYELQVDRSMDRSKRVEATVPVVYVVALFSYYLALVGTFAVGS